MIKVKLTDWEYECGDHCCYESSTSIDVIEQCDATGDTDTVYSEYYWKNNAYTSINTLNELLSSLCVDATAEFVDHDIKDLGTYYSAEDHDEDEEFTGLSICVNGEQVFWQPDWYNYTVCEDTLTRLFNAIGLEDVEIVREEDYIDYTEYVDEDEDDDELY